MMYETWKHKKKNSPKKHPHSHKVFVWIMFALFGGCVYGIIYFLRLPSYQIADIKVENTLLTNEDEIRSVVSRHLKGSYIYLIPKSNIFLYPKKKIKSELSTIPSILGVEIALSRADNTLSVYITERKHQYVWCRQESKCYYMDATGYVFAEAPLFEGNIFLVFKGDIQGEPLGSHFLNSEQLSRLIAFADHLKQIGIDVAMINIISLYNIEVYLKSYSRIIISLEDDLDTTLSHIKTILISDEFTRASGGLNSIDYIDLRYGTKGFWKEKV